ncbi:alpha-galactosidase [Sphingorhabdus arenilitoris]|uniref:alpha-galactosidase n=1 Tax=Sphingorhabdus arenilitoris TaxID=1490041 RepID=A0ABV8RHX1_9SPHN
MEHIRFDAGEMTLIIACVAGQPPHFVYWGKRLSGAVTADDVASIGQRQAAHGCEAVPIAPSIAMEPGLGLLGLHGFAAHRGGRDWGSLFGVVNVKKNGGSAVIETNDPRTKLTLTYTINCDPKTGLIELTSQLTNNGDAPLTIDHMATACLPIPSHMTDIIGFSGRWANEFQRERLKRFSGCYLRENRRGKTSHDSFPAVMLCADTTREQAGEAYGLHLAWSGNHRLRVDSLNDGQLFASAGALFFPGEMQLAPGESYHSPAIIAAYSSSGLSALSRQFHDHVRQNLLRPETRARPRPVHYNSWEAVYFFHNIDQLKAIADKAANLGVERFVLDDGWFGSRRNDTAGLGDWTVSDAVYPGGLKPLIDHVTALGMEMGLWFEPEMVNPDSDLFRAHPDWVLQIDGVEQVPFRNQYVLDISRPEVSDYLFDCIDAILSEYNIGYIKWDMNRDLNHPGGRSGHARAHAQVEALYRLMDRVRAAHPKVEIESCCSGGGRADMGILAHSDRIWTSDSNDALDRQDIQRGASYFLPLCVLGSHVGPRHCHITGRTLSIEMRCATALMGHMGTELNLLTEAESDLAIMKQAITLYKTHRQLLHDGDLYRLDTEAHINAVGVVAADKAEALFSIAYLTGHKATLPGKLQFDGLDPAQKYRVRLIWPVGWQAVRPPAITDHLDLTGEGNEISGEALMGAGMQLPLSFPETVLLFHLAAAHTCTDRAA